MPPKAKPEQKAEQPKKAEKKEEAKKAEPAKKTEQKKEAKPAEQKKGEAKKAEPKKAEAKPAKKAEPKAEPKKAEAKPKAAEAAAKPVETKKKTETAGIYLKGLPSDLQSVDAIKKFLKSLGTITSVRMRGGKYCLVWFDNAGSAKKAIESFHNKTIKGSKVTVHAAKAQPPRDRSEYCSTVFIDNLGRNHTRDAIRAGLEKFGKVLKIRTYRYGFGFAYFDSVSAANKCKKELDGKDFLGHRVHVKLSIRTKARDELRNKRAQKTIRVWQETRRYLHAAATKKSAKKE